MELATGSRAIFELNTILNLHFIPHHFEVIVEDRIEQIRCWYMKLEIRWSAFDDFVNVELV